MREGTGMSSPEAIGGLQKIINQVASSWNRVTTPR
jgi:hypothetical protein